MISPAQQNKRPTITMPPNLQEVKFKFPRRRSAKVMGTLADIDSEPLEGDTVNGVLVTHNFKSKIVAPQDLSTYTPLRVGSISSKLHVPFAASVDTLKLFLNEMFSGVTQTEHGEGADGATVTTFGLHNDDIKVITGKSRGVAIVQWEASPEGDVIADAVVALLMHAQSSTASIRLTSKPCRHPRAVDEDEEVEPTKKQKRDDNATSESRLRLVRDTLKDQFETVEAVFEGNTGTFEITLDAALESGTTLGEDGTLVCTATVAFDDASGSTAKITVECADKRLGTNVQECLQNLAAAAAPIDT